MEEMERIVALIKSCKEGQACFAGLLVAAVVFSLLVFATFLLTTSASTSLFGAAFFDVVEEVEDTC